MDEFYTKVAGVTFEGRQRYIRHMRVGERLTLERDRHNAYDSNAIRIYNESGENIGFIPREIAAQMAPKMDGGINYTAVCSAITGNNPGDNLGVNIEVSECEPIIRDEFDEYNYIEDDEDKVYPNEEVEDENSLIGQNHLNKEESLITKVIDFFDNISINYEILSDTSIRIIAPIKNKLKNIIFTIFIDTEDNGIEVWANIDVSADSDSLLEVMKYITLVNWNASSKGKLELDIFSGEIRFSTYKECNLNDSVDEDIKSALTLPRVILEEYGDELLAVIFGMKTGEEAYNSAESSK